MIPNPGLIKTTMKRKYLILEEKSGKYVARYQGGGCWLVNEYCVRKSSTYTFTLDRAMKIITNYRSMNWIGVANVCGNLPRMALRVVRVR